MLLQCGTGTVGGLCGGASSPLPPPERLVAAGDMENDGALCAPRHQPNGPAPVIGADGPRFVYIWAKRRRPRSPGCPPAPAPARHFSFLRFPFALSFASCSPPVSPGTF